MKEIKILSALVQRLKEPSTWATISAVLLAFGLTHTEIDRVTQAGIGIATLAAILLGIFLPEGEKK